MIHIREVAKSESGKASALSAGAWFVVGLLTTLLLATLVMAYLGWTSGERVEIPSTIYVEMGLGVVLSFAVGFGLMSLIFYSSRRGFDEPPIILNSDDEEADRN